MHKKGKAKTHLRVTINKENYPSTYDVKGRLTEQQALFLQEFCEKNKLSVSGGLREVVNRYIETCKIKRDNMETA